MSLIQLLKFQNMGNKAFQNVLFLRPHLQTGMIIASGLHTKVNRTNGMRKSFTVVFKMYLTAISFPLISQNILKVSQHSIYHKEAL